MLNKIVIKKKKNNEEDLGKLDMNGFWGTLENLIVKERKRAASSGSFNDAGKWILSGPVRSGANGFVCDVEKLIKRIYIANKYITN